MLMDWHALMDKVDSLCDEHFGEPVFLIPWSSSESSDGYPDFSRNVVEAIAIPILDKTSPMRRLAVDQPSSLKVMFAFPSAMFLLTCLVCARTITLSFADSGSRCPTSIHQSSQPEELSI